MTLTLLESQTISELASHLYDFLPGKAHPFADQRISFYGIAHKLSLQNFWSEGSKLPAIIQLVTLTLEKKRDRFCDLIIEIVLKSIAYRQGKTPLTRDEIEYLNTLVAKVGFKIPELYDPKFLESLPRIEQTEEKSQNIPSKEILINLQQRILELSALPAQKRGLEFESFLSELFESYGLAPRNSFQLVGEQIDGSFSFQEEIYLVEAKWQTQKIGNSELLVFYGKISGKAKWSRGLFISHSGFTEEGIEAFMRGRATNIICMNGLDLYHILSGKLDLREVLKLKVRRAAETNHPFVPVRELFGGII